MFSRISLSNGADHGRPNSDRRPSHLQARKPRDFSDPPNLFGVLDGDHFDFDREHDPEKWAPVFP
jgi:hypothetical protein